jgi:hypothetical protein
MSNDFLKTRLLGLELEALGYKNPLLRLKAGRSIHYATKARDGFVIPEHGGESIGPGGVTFSQWLAQQRDDFPEDFEAANAPAPKSIDGNGGAAAQLDDIDLAAARGGHTRQEFLLLLPGARMSLFDEIKGGAAKPWESGVRARPHAGIDPAALARMTVEERLDAVNADYFRQLEGRS